MSAITAAPDSSPKPRLWIVHPAVDLIVGCGAWTIPLFLLTAFLADGHLTMLAIGFYFLTIFCNQPHYMATIYRAYGTRGDFQKYKVFTLYITVFLLMTAGATHYAPILIPWLLTIYLTWSPWHYTGQNFGIAMMYARRGNAITTTTTRHLLYASFLASYAMWFLSIHSAFQDNPYFVTLGVPPDFARIAAVFSFAIYIVAGSMAILRMVHQSGLRAVVPVLVLLSTQFCWFVLPILMMGADKGLATPLYYTTGALAFMHCAQYLWITSYYAHREATATGRADWKPAAYFGGMIIGGIALFLPGPWIVSRVFQYDLVESYLIFVALINLHHFILDGAIWKLRDGRIARLLLGSAGSPAHGAQADAGALNQTAGWLLGGSSGARALRYTAVIALVGLAVVDQMQNYLATTGKAGSTEWAYTVNPWDSRARRQRAQALREAGDIDGAIRVLQRDPSKPGSNAEAQRDLAALLLTAGRPEEAFEVYTSLDRRGALEETSARNYASMLAQRGRIDDAAGVMARAVARQPQNPDNARLYAEILLQQNDPHAAIVQFDRYLELVPKENLTPSQQANIARASLQLGQALRRVGRTADAEETFRATAELARVAELHAVGSQALGELAAIAADEGRDDFAERLYAAAAQVATLAGDNVLRATHLVNAGLMLRDHDAEAARRRFVEAKSSLANIETPEADQLRQVIATESP